MTGILVNVGLERRSGGQLDPSTVLRAFREQGFAIADSALHRSDSEDTVVMQVAYPAPLGRLRVLARMLEQDAIAVREESGAGELFGDEARKWGEFDPAKFVLLDGSRAAYGDVK